MGRRKASSRQTTIGQAAKSAGQTMLVDSMNTVLETVYIPAEAKGAAHVECLQRVAEEWAARLVWMTYYSIPAIDITRMPFLSSELRLQKEYGKLLWEISKLIRVLWETVPEYRKDYPWAHPLIVWQKVALELRNRDQELKTKAISNRPTTDERKRWEECIEHLQASEVQTAMQALGEGFDMPHLERILRVSVKARAKLKGQRLKDFNIDGWTPFVNQLEKMRLRSFKMPAPYQATSNGLQLVEGKPHMATAKPVPAQPMSAFNGDDPNLLAVFPLRLEINAEEGRVDLQIVEIKRVRNFGENTVFVK